MIQVAHPATLTEALEALSVEPRLLPIAGCTDLMVGDPLQRASRIGILDLTGIADLKEIDEGPELISIGAGVTFTEIGSSPIVLDRLPSLAAAATSIGGWQIQNRATLGGNIANASPAGDSLPVLLALDAFIVVAGVTGERIIPYREFHTDYRKTVLEPSELIVRIEVPIPSDELRQAFRKVGTRKAQAISKVVVAGCVRLDGGEFAEVRIAAGSVAATPIRLHEVETLLLGERAVSTLAAEAGRRATQSVRPIDDVRSTADYRAWVLGRVVRRMILGLLAPPRRPKFV